MKEPNRVRKNDIKYNVVLNEEQKQAKQLIIDNQIVIITGRAGSGKSLVGAQAALDFLNKKQCDKILVTRSAIEVGRSLGFLPGALEDKFNPYMEALIENLYKCMDKIKIDDFVKTERVQALPVQFIRGKTIDDVLIVAELRPMVDPLNAAPGRIPLMLDTFSVYELRIRKRPVPATSRVVAGAAVPIPTFDVEPWM
jgi:phosphate starvation-inducible protein PhoH